MDGALIAYLRCFSPRSAVLTDADLDGLDHQDEFGRLHGMLRQARDHVASSPRPLVDEPTVRMLGRLAYHLAGRVDARMREAQRKVLDEAAELPPVELGRLPVVQLSEV